jgi:hypothetical protein
MLSRKSCRVLRASMVHAPAHQNQGNDEPCQVSNGERTAAGQHADTVGDCVLSDQRPKPLTNGDGNRNQDAHDVEEYPEEGNLQIAGPDSLGIRVRRCAPYGHKFSALRHSTKKFYDLGCCHSLIPGSSLTVLRTRARKLSKLLWSDGGAGRGCRVLAPAVLPETTMRRARHSSPFAA